MNSLPNIALTIKQPWASLIITGGKDIENRSWPTKFRGPVLIHASKAVDEDEYLGAYNLTRSRFIDLPVKWVMSSEGSSKDDTDWRNDELPCGGIIGMAEIVDCVRDSKSPWFVGEFGFVLANPRPLPFHACRGALGFWRCDYPESTDTAQRVPTT